MKINEILHLSADAGKIILQNGGETYRVEDTIKMICNAYDVPYTESFVTPTGIIISVTDKNNNTISLVKRISSRTVNLEKVKMVNDLSRKITKTPLPIDKVKKELEYINKIKIYNNKVTSLFAATATGSFTLLFGGNFKDFIIAFITGYLINSLSSILNKLEVNNFFINMIGGSLAAIIALITVHFGLGSNADKIIIGSIMILVPGLAITNAIRDTIAGDLVSGISRSIEAFFIAIAIAAGTGVTHKLWLMLFGGV